MISLDVTENDNSNQITTNNMIIHCDPIIGPGLIMGHASAIYNGPYPLLGRARYRAMFRSLIR